MFLVITFDAAALHLMLQPQRHNKEPKALRGRCKTKNRRINNNPNYKGKGAVEESLRAIMVAEEAAVGAKGDGEALKGVQKRKAAEWGPHHARGCGHPASRGGCQTGWDGDQRGMAAAPDPKWAGYQRQNDGDW